MGKSLSSDSARARSQKQKEASRRAAPDARERIPTGAGGSIISTVHTNDFLLELFLDRTDLQH
jgi:hypothetical protein